MIERFKRYLEREFRAIKPTQAAMEHREEILTQLLEKEQDLRIKGMTDDDLIYDMCIDGLGDFRQALIDFENREIAVKKTGRKVGIGLIAGVGAALMLVCAYLITSFAVPGSWGWTWLILVGGIFAGVIAGSLFAAVKLYGKKKYLIFRGLVAESLILVCVYAFLILQILVNLPHAWLTFLVMVVLVAGLDAVLADFTGNKFKYIEYGVFVEIFCVMLYVILGITMGLWHPYWVLCIAGVVIDVIALGIGFGVHSKKKIAVQEDKIKKHDLDEKDEYYTEWKDRK